MKNKKKLNVLRRKQAGAFLQLLAVQKAIGILLPKILTQAKGGAK